MKRIVILISAALLAGTVFAQSMMNSGSSSTNAGSMTAPATADPKVGRELRLAKSTGHKVIFTDMAAAQALATTGPVVLFFAADWCPNCQADLKDINANGVTLKEIVVVVLDYDKEKAVKKQFGVTVQDTFVQINAKGVKLAAWNGGGVAGILQYLVRK